MHGHHISSLHTKTYLMRLFLISCAMMTSVLSFVSTLAATTIPTFYIDPYILELSKDRQECLRKGSAIDELNFLRDESASEYFRSHELFSQTFFIESKNNPHRRYIFHEAELEYIPLLPLSWRVNSAPNCGYAPMIQTILKIQSYLVERDAKLKNQNSSTQIKPKFSVASTFNMRTALGTGMPTQLRKGEAWTAVSNFVMSLAIGHYERWPQCPDLLRKSWKYVVEMPYVPANTVIGENPSMIGSSDIAGGVSSGDNKQTSTPSVSTGDDNNRKFMFHFAGTFDLYGCEMVCSVRNSILNVSTRSDILVVNTTASDAYSRGVDRNLEKALQNSVFCLVTKGDSYSTSFFYSAISNGCIPVVISDWFVFAYNWAVPYEQFVIRISEDDFNTNTNYILDYISNTIGQNKVILNRMRDNMRRYKGLLSFNHVGYMSAEYIRLMNNDVYVRQSGSNSNYVQTANSVFNTIIPLELLLLEIRYAQRDYSHYNSVPCYRPYMCLHNREIDDRNTTAARKGDYTYYPKQKSVLERQKQPAVVWNKWDYTADKVDVMASSHSKIGSEIPVLNSSNSDLVLDSGMQVNYLYIPPYIHNVSFGDTRSHLCRHNGRLIGHYKIVFFMQCVRILWPLSPGQFKPVDNANRFIGTLPGGSVAGSKDTSSVVVNGISEADYHYVRAFHNISRPANWYLTNYPIHSGGNSGDYGNGRKNVHTLQSLGMLF